MSTAPIQHVNERQGRFAFVDKSTKAESWGKSSFKEGFNINSELRIVQRGGVATAEFLGTGDFANAFFERQRYEVDAGRASEPLLYDQIYSITQDDTLPRLVSINTLGTTGIVFERVEENGEVKMASVGEGSKSVEMYHYAVGLEYNEDLFIYNELFRLPVIERNFGIAFNAMMNHVHLSPILTYSYGSANSTDGTALTYTSTQTLPERYLRTFEEAISAAVGDTTNPRRGPYVILCATANVFTIERALRVVAQQGFDAQSSAISRIQGVIAYDGASLTRGLKTTSYAGVSSGFCYLVDISNRDTDFQSWVKQPLRVQRGEGDMSRFVVEKVVFDTRFGVFADPARAVENITLPTMA